MGLFNKEPTYDNVPPVRPSAPQQPAANPNPAPQQPVYPPQNYGQPTGAPQQPGYQQPYPQPTPAQAMLAKAERTLNNYRVTLLLVAILSLANCLLAQISDTYLMFSLFFPYDLSWNLNSYWGVPVPLLIALAVLMVAAMFLCWALSKKTPKVAWIAFLVYLADTVYMLTRVLSNAGNLIALLFHAYVLFCIAQIVAAARQLERARKALAEEQSPVHNGQAPCNHPPVEL